FVGFEHESGASIVIAELPGPYDEIVPGLTDEGFAGQGVTVTARTELTIGGLPGLLVEGTQSAAGARFGKVILVTGVAALTVMVNGNYPIDETAIGAAIREAALTISVDPERSTDPAAVLTFTVDPAPPLRFAGAFVNAGAYNTSGAFPSADIDEPFFIVAPSLGVAAPGDLEGFAVQRLQETATVRNVQIESTKEITIAGRPGIEIVATATRASRPGEVVVYQVLLGGDEDYVVMSGICAADRAEECLAAFAATAATFEPLP
ncbi:MAG TPA: hypothetical protein VFX65_00865, partial [Candidatus Limnocylindrales bacterium]|nr:hypothetical protein [Candidatus Limnocylindrales bacterium]